MPRVYTCELPKVTRGTASFDAFEITPADDKPVQIIGVDLQVLTETGDAAEEWLEWTIRRGGTGMTSGSAGTGSIAAASGVGTAAGIDPGSGFTYDAGNTTVATFTSGVICWHSAFNERIGLPLWTPPPELWIGCSQANGGIVVRIETTSADAYDICGTLTVQELP